MDLHLELPQLVDLDLKTSSCFRRLEVEEHVSLLPCYIGRIGHGVTEHLNLKVMRYSESYRGVLLAYSMPIVLQTTGRIMDEQPHLHFDIRYSAYTFKPVVGSILCGTVNKIGRDHVGCLVYRCFNASITQRHSAKKNSSTGRNGVWIDPRDSQCDIGAEICFRVMEIEVLDGVLSIKGELIDMDAETSDGMETTNSKKHKKHKKHRHDDSADQKVKTKTSHRSRLKGIDQQSDLDSTVRVESFSHDSPKVKHPDSSPGVSLGIQSPRGKKRKRIDESTSHVVGLSSPLKNPRTREDSDKHHKHKSKKHKK